MIPITPIKSGQSILRPRARIIKTIGEELISSDIVAVIELVKNSYDADAEIVIISIDGPIIKVIAEEEEDSKPKKKKKKAPIEIEKIVGNSATLTVWDDGIGMSLSTITGAWMEPATISKKVQKYSAAKNRRHTGEKGIGRFASAKIGSELEIISRIESDNEVVAKIDWSRFGDLNQYLDQIPWDWEVREPRAFSNGHGTQLSINKLSSDWTREKISLLRGQLQRLINPVTPVINFLIELRLPQNFSDLAGMIEPPSTLTHPMYFLKGKFDGGVAKFEFVGKKNKASISESVTLLKEGEKSKTGPFEFEFRVWDLDGDSTGAVDGMSDVKVGQLRKDLSQVAGISIYRDQFRVLPYGEPKYDWARLDLRRVNNPTLRLSNNQIIGYVSITSDANPDFVDQSNREGLVDSEAFDQLKLFVRAILNEIEQRRYLERPRENDPEPSSNSIFGRFNVQPLIDLIRQKLPDDKDVESALEATQINLNEGVRKVKDVISRYRRLSTLVQLVDRILHDANTYLETIDGSVKIIRKRLGHQTGTLHTIEQKLNTIDVARSSMFNLFKRLEPFGGRKSKSRTIIVENEIHNAFLLLDSELKKSNINTSLPSSSTEFDFDPYDLQQILINLIQNSIYWLDGFEDKQISVTLVEIPDELHLVFSDSGPGVKEGYESLIFDPYFSTKPDGIGLGLTIIGELVIENGGHFELIQNGPLKGATFRLRLKRKI